MKAISEKEMSGYQLIHQIEKDTGSWKPSTGSIYPLLDNLTKEGLVTFRKDKKKKLYSLTKKGKTKLTMIMGHTDTIIDNMKKSFKVFESISGKEKTSFINDFLKRIQKGKMPFSQFQPEASELKIAFFRLADLKSKQDIIKVKAIMKETTNKLRKIK